MAESELAAIVLLVVMSLLAIVAAALVTMLFRRPPRPRLATPTPLPIPRQDYGQGMVYRSLTPSSLPRLPAYQPAAVHRLAVTGPAARLTIHSGPLQGSQFPVARPVFALGRSSLCDITLPDPQASRQHARLEWRRDGLYLVDTNSTNGTYVNGYRIGQVRLRGGEQVQISGTVFTIQVY
jgi:hypothetical protein